MDTDKSHVGGLTCAEAGNPWMETGNAQVGVGPRAVPGVVAMTGLGLCVVGGDGGDGRRYRGRGGGYRSRE